ncbi:hypothetical protein EON66_00800 [archaeon]|nr:MAG: hypothetical protein EON66_00800 [archaeon]
MLQHERREAELLRDLLRERATDRASMPHRASPPVRSAVASQSLFSSPKRASQETTVAPPAASPAVRTDASPTQRVHDDTDGVDASHLGGTFRRALIERQPNTPAQVNLLTTSSGLDVGGHATATWMHTLDSTPSPLFSVSVRRAGEARGGGGGGSGMQQHFRSRSPSLSPKPARACSRSRSRGTQATARLQRRGSADAAVGSGFPDTLTTRSGDAGMQQPAAAHLAFGSSRSAAPASHASTREPKTGRSLTVDAGSSSSAAAPARLVSPSKPVERGRTLSGRASGPSPSPPHRSQSSSSVGRRGTRSGAGSPSFGGARPPSLRGDDAEVVRWKSIMSRLDTVSRLQSDRSPARR